MPYATKQSLRQAEQDFDPIYEQIKKIGETDMVVLAQKLDADGSPYVPSKLPEWKQHSRQTQGGCGLESNYLV